MSIADTNFNDDDYNYEPSEQKQSAPPAMVLMPGVYKVNAQLLPRKDDNGEDVVSVDDQGNAWPKYVIPGIEVVEPMDEGGRFDVWHDVATRPGRWSEDEPYKSDGAILLNAIDSELAQNAGSFGNAAKALAEKASSGEITFTVSTGLTARDSDWAKAEIARLGLSRENGDGKEISKIWRKANLPTKTFMIQKGSKGVPSKYALTAKSPLSGKMVRAKVKISKFIPANTDGVVYGVGQFPPKD